MRRCGATVMWRLVVVVTATTQLHSSKPELGFCAGSNSACGRSEIRDDEVPVGGKAFRQSTIPQKQFIIIILKIIMKIV